MSGSGSKNAGVEFNGGEAGLKCCGGTSKGFGNVIES
jgi:hypothetical protein